MDKRQIVPPQSTPIVHRPIVAPTTQSSRSAQIIAPRHIVSPASVRRAASRRMIGRSRVSGFAMQPDVLGAATASLVKLGDPDVAGTQFFEITRDLEAHKFRSKAVPISETVRTDPCFAGGRFHQSRAIEVLYTRTTKPQPNAWPEEIPQAAPLPIIRYPDGECFGNHPYLELTDNTYCTTVRDGRNGEVKICGAGMLLLMEQVRGEWIHWPLDLDGNIQDVPLCGRVSEGLVEARSSCVSEPILQPKDVDCKKIVFAIEVLQGDQKSIYLIVTDRTGKKHALEIRYTDSFFA